MITYTIKKSAIKDRTYIPKYYDPLLSQEIQDLSLTCTLLPINLLIAKKMIEVDTGHEIGKLAYGTGDIPFVRTSDISNWEIKSAPKQGVSQEIFDSYSKSQDVNVGDILIVRDGTYLIGTNCLVTKIDEKIIYQSHIIKIRVNENQYFDSYLFFTLINTEIFQKQIRSVQFTADTIDTIGNRFNDLILPVPNNEAYKKQVSESVKKSLDQRVLGKAFIKQAPLILEQILENNTVQFANDFLCLSIDEIIPLLKHETVTGELGKFETYMISSNEIRDRVFLPKFYDPEIIKELHQLKKYCECKSIEELVNEGIIEVNTGDEIGKMAYGTGIIPFIRTSDFSNWEIKYDPKQGISDAIYNEYCTKQNVETGDILLVRDGTYLVGSCCMVSSEDSKMLYCGGIYKIKVLNNNYMTNWLLLGLLNSYVVKRQMRNKQFTRDVIDTLGKRFYEVILPIPKSEGLKKELSDIIESVFNVRIKSRDDLRKIVNSLFKK